MRAKSFRNEYDGHTIEESLLQVERITGKKVRRMAGDRGYRERKEVNGTQILIPDAPNKKGSYRTRKKETQTILQAYGNRTYYRTHEIRLQFRTQLYKGGVRRRRECSSGCGGIQLQKNHEASLGTYRKNQRDTLLEKCLASIYFLRDNYLA